MTSIISIRDLWVYRDAQIVLEDINLDLDSSDFLGLIGPNGGGKSTLLKIVLGLIKPSRGSIEIFGQNPAMARKSVGYMPQKTIFDKNFPLNALEVVLMGRFSRAGLMKRYNSGDQQAALDALAAVGMKDRAQKQIGLLSGGEQQRVFVARSLVGEPKLLLLDEPTTGIDAAQQSEFYELLSRLSQNMAIILVSHDLTAVSKYVNKIACLNQKLYYHGTKELTNEDIEKAYGCPVDMIAHGTPHRVLREHD
jgi:zinc transport system ATP-binding protein